MSLLFRQPGRYLIFHWAITLALASTLLVPRDTPRSSTSADMRIVTLLTGQTIALDSAGMPRAQAGITETRQTSTDSYAFPSVVAGAVGVFWDPRLFDVTYLEAHGFGDDRSAIVPLLITFANHEQALQAYARRTLDGGIHITHAFEYLPLASGYISKSGPFAPASWGAYAAPGTIRSQSALLSLNAVPDGHVSVDRFGITGLFLDDVVQPSPTTAQPLLDAALPIIGADKAHEAGITGKGVRIAVVDTGIDDTHPDLQGRVVAARNFSTDRDALDHFGHGTHVAGIAAGTGAASAGKYMGVAPDAQLINAKALNSRGGGTDSGIIAAMEWAADEGAKVINMSLGGGQSDGTDPMSRAVNSISEKKGVLFVIAAGNSGSSQKVSTPAAADLSIAVGAIDKDIELAVFSSRGPRLKDMALKPDIVAPGVSITAPRANHGSGDPYATYSGTSMAAPMTAGSAALVWQIHPAWKAAQVKDALMSAASPIGVHCAVSPYDQGAGAVNLRNILLQKAVFTPGSVSFGKITGTGERVVRISNVSTKALVIALTAQACSPSNGGSMSVTPATVTLPAGSSATATVKVHGYSGKGQFFGELRTTEGSEMVANMPIALVLQ